jgi:hypothetical protein
MPSTVTKVGARRITNVVVDPGTTAGRRYRSSRQVAARAPGFPAEPGLNLRNFGGRTIERFTFTHVYLGGAAAWSPDDIAKIDWALPAAMRDPYLNNVLAQYFPAGKPVSAFGGSRILEGPVPQRVFRDTVEHFAAALDVSGFELESTAFCFFLPRGVVLVDGTSTGQAHRRDPGEEPEFNPALRKRDEAADSRHGLGGYHGSVHRTRGAQKQTIYYAVGVYDEGQNGIVVFPESWKNVCAVFYHELCEVRTDPDVEDAIRAGDTPEADRFLGWYSPRGGEVGDIPLDEAWPDLTQVIKEVKLATRSTKVPVQLMWSNAVAGPEGPIARPHRRA